jgi:hypothetical protein
MMRQTGDFRHLNDFALRNRLYSSCFWGVFAQRQMSSPTMVISAISRERATQRAFVEYNIMVQALAPNGANEPLHISPLPRTPGRRQYLFDSHCPYLADKLLAEDPIAVAQQIAWRTLPRKSIPQLLHRPLRCRIIRASYARTMETPFNENLIIANTGCSNPVIAFIVPPPNITCASGLIQPGWRNEFHAGLEQAIGKYLVVSAECITKYTHNGYDFGVVAASPIAFPIAWHNSKIPGFAGRVSVPNFHGFTALVVMSSVSARFFPPHVGGVPFLPAPGVFRIDHDERFNQTTHLQYQPWKRGPWLGFNWRYDSGLVAGAIPCSAPTATCFASTPVADGGGANIPSGQVAFTNNLTGLPLTADQEFQAGLTCDGKPAAPRKRRINSTASIVMSFCVL